MAGAYPILHYGVTRISDGGGGSIKLPDRSSAATVWVDSIIQSDGETQVLVPAEQPIRIGDLLKIPHEAFARS